MVADPLNESDDSLFLALPVQMPINTSGDSVPLHQLHKAAGLALFIKRWEMKDHDQLSLEIHGRLQESSKRSSSLR